MKITAQKKYLVLIAGPTAVGKTDLAIKLARYYNTVILSADSRQFYKELTIGTAKPNEAQLKEVNHYFIDTKNINELYGAGHFEKDVLKILDELFKVHSLVIMVGGSGLYIDAVLNGVDEFMEVPLIIREELNKKFKAEGLEWLQKEIEKKDRDYFNQVDKNNPQRLIRALEIMEYTGLPYSGFLTQKKTERNFTPIKIMLNIEREKLYDRINKRVDEMMDKGLLEEVRQLHSYKNFNALKTVGYRELHEYLEGKYSLETAVEKIKQHTRNYAKRQITWFKNKDIFEQFSPDNYEEIIKYIDSVMLHE
jgi:tRNA dimethylallyltransferase